MKFDRNTVIGFSLLAVLFIFYFVYNSKLQTAARAEQAKQDSIAKAMQPKVDSAALRLNALKADSQLNVTKAGMFQQAATGRNNWFLRKTVCLKLLLPIKEDSPSM